MWKEVRHIILELNLKERPQHTTGNEAMKILSKELLQQLQFLNSKSYILNTHECAANVCKKELCMYCE